MNAKGLSDYLAEAAERRLTASIEAAMKPLHEAEEAAAAAKATPRTYQVSYRISSSFSASRGDGDGRRRAVMALIKSLEPEEQHMSTSTWIVRLHLASADDVAALLAVVVDEALDFLAVAEVTANRSTRGDAGLRS